MSRYEDNKKILKKIEQMVEQCKDLRFVQLLWALNIVNSEDRFYEESSETLKKIEHELEKINQ